MIGDRGHSSVGSSCLCGKEGHARDWVVTGPHGQIIKFAGAGQDFQQALELGLGSEGGGQELDGGVGNVVVGGDHAQVEGLQVHVILYGDNLAVLQV